MGDIIRYDQSIAISFILYRQNMEEETSRLYKPDPLIFTCSVCQGLYEKPVTLACGHTYCHFCLAQKLQNLTDSQVSSDNNHSLVPLCPKCQQIIWRPLAHLKENVVIANLMSRYQLARPQPHPPLGQIAPPQHQYHILLECHQVNVIPMPHCTTKVVFTTAFMDEIIEQQSQTNPIMLQWPGAPSSVAIAGRISRPEIYHYSLRIRPHETTFRAQFEGLFYVSIEQRQKISVTNHQNLEGGNETQSFLTLCRSAELKAANPVPLDGLHQFFQVYDQLNNPIYLRQISQLANERVLNERNDPQALMYCIMRVLRFSDKELKHLVDMMDDQERWKYIEEYLLKNGGKAPVDTIKVDIPGNYPHELLFILLFLLLILYYFTQ